MAAGITTSATKNQCNVDISCHFKATLKLKRQLSLVSVPAKTRFSSTNSLMATLHCTGVHWSSWSGDKLAKQGFKVANGRGEVSQLHSMIIDSDTYCIH